MYFANYDADGKLISIGTGMGQTEITEQEYNALHAQIMTKIACIEQLYGGEITEDDVPQELRDEVVSTVESRLQAEADADMSPEDIMSALEAIL